MRRQFWATALLVVITNVASHQLPAMANSIPDQLPAELIFRLFSMPFFRNAKLLLNQLPPQFPETLALPQRAELLASVVFEQEQHSEIILSTPNLPNQIEQTYLPQLEAQGWKVDRQFSDQEKPELAQPNILLRRFVQNQTSVLVAVAPNVNGTGSQVRLTVTMQVEPFDTDEVEKDFLHLRSLVDDLKLLMRSLPQSETQFLHGEGTNRQYRAMLRVKTRLSRKELIERLNHKQTLGEWKRHSSGNQAALIWSLWRQRDAQDRSWLGIVQLVESTLPQQYIVYITIGSPKEQFWKFDGPKDVSNSRTLPRSLALRLLNISENQAASRLFVGTLPPLPKPLPLPSLPTIGGIFRPSKNYYALFDASSNEDVLVSYANQLSQAGWQPSEVLNGETEIDRIGFVDNYNFVARTFCQGESQTLSIFQVEPSRLHLSLVLEPYENSPCQVRKPLSLSQAETRNLLNVIPKVRLTSPRVSQVESQSTLSHCPNSLSSLATINTPLKLVELAQHYEVQMVNTGWKLIAKDGNENIQQSMWVTNRNDQQWEALLNLIHSNVNSNSYQAMLLLSNPDCSK